MARFASVLLVLAVFPSVGSADVVNYRLDGIVAQAFSPDSGLQERTAAGSLPEGSELKIDLVYDLATTGVDPLNYVVPQAGADNFIRVTVGDCQFVSDAGGMWEAHFQPVIGGFPIPFGGDTSEAARFECPLGAVTSTECPTGGRIALELIGSGDFFTLGPTIPLLDFEHFTDGLWALQIDLEFGGETMTIHGHVTGLAADEPEPEALAVEIDVKPGSMDNPINVRYRGIVPVAILTTEAFDATTVGPSTLALGPANAPADKSSMLDVDRDGDTDLIAHFRTEELGLVGGETEIMLIGATLDGAPIVGVDAIRLVGGNGQGHEAKSGKK